MLAPQPTGGPPAPRAQRVTGAAAVMCLALLALALSPGRLPAEESEHPCPDGDWLVRCDIDDCGPMADVFAQDLETATRWLLGLGFDRMAIEEASRTCVARISDETWDEELQTRTLGTYDADSEKLFLWVDLDEELMQAETEEDFEQGLRDLYTPVHELFHAVQEGYYGEDDHEGIAWITEGTAEAVMMAYVKHHEPDNLAPVEMRRFDHPLHRPDPYLDDDDDTARFWIGVGTLIESRDHVQYLREVLRQVALDDAEHDGLPAVDSALESWGGLYRLYPRFLARRIEWNEETFGEARELAPVRLPAGDDEETWTRPERGTVEVAEVAGRWMRLEADPGGGDRPVELTVWIEDDLPELHLLVENELFSRAVPRNRYTTVVAPGERRPLDVVVANVAETAVETEPREVRLGVRLRELNQCSLTARVTGYVNGTYSGDVAHFSTEGGATIYGAFSNPERVQEVIEGMAEMMEAMGGERPDTSDWEPPPGEEMPRETLGISASDLQLDGGEEQALGSLVGGFRMEASVIGAAVEEGFTGGLQLASLRVTPGGRAAGDLQQVPFVWKEGEPGSAHLDITHFSGGLLVGTITGQLFSQGYYDPDTRQPAQISVQAQLVALPGPTGCMEALMY